MLGRYRLPKAKLGLWNSDLPHMDEQFWNTKGGQYPVSEFWAERFLVEEGDPASGPVRPEARTKEGRGGSGEKEDRKGKVSFTTEGLDGSWVPYGGEFSFFGLLSRPLVFDWQLKRLVC